MAVKTGYTNVYRDPLGYPEWHARGFPVNSEPAGVTGLEKIKEASHPPGRDSFGPLHGWAMVWTLLGIFVGGMALNLTPCVYPLIPITISYFGGRSGSGHPIVHGGCYVAGIAVTNSLLGVFAALTGSLMGALLQHPLMLVLISLLLVSLAFSLFGLWEIRVPYGLMQIAATSHAGYAGSLFMGLMMGIVAAPCIGPFVLGLLTWVAGMGSPWTGFIIFFTLSLGLGLPFFFLVLFSGSIAKLPGSGEWMLWVRKLMGWVLMGMAAYFIHPLFSETIGIIVMAAVPLCAGIHLGWIDRTRATFKSFKWIKTAVPMMALVYTTVLAGTLVTKGEGAGYEMYDNNRVALARKEGKSVIIDFSAEWCSPCRAMDDLTLRDGTVVEQLKKDFLFIKVDLTRKGNPVHEELLEKYAVKGVPTFVFLDRNGREIKSLRLVDFEPPELFLERLNKARQSMVN